MRLQSRRLKRPFLRQLPVLLMALLLHQSLVAAPITGKFSLVNHHGEQVTEKTYSGTLKLVFFGFTQCPIVCPTTMADISAALTLLAGQSEQVSPLFITIDPENDTSSALADYLQFFHPRIVGLTGTSEAISDTAKNFNVTYGKANNEIYHTTYLYIFDHEGEFLDVIGYGTAGKEIARQLRAYL